jgi:hypothetical protein
MGVQRRSRDRHSLNEPANATQDDLDRRMRNARVNEGQAWGVLTPPFLRSAGKMRRRVSASSDNRADHEIAESLAELRLLDEEIE